MTVPSPESALMAEILAAVRKVDADVSKVSAELGTVKVEVARAVAEIGHGAKRQDDLERRVKKLEESQGAAAVDATSYVTKDDLEKSQDKRARKTAWIVGIVVALITPIEAAIIAAFLNG